MTTDFLSSIIKGEPYASKNTGDAEDPFYRGKSRVPAMLPGLEEFNRIDDAIALVVRGSDLKGSERDSLMKHFAAYNPVGAISRVMCALVLFGDRAMRDRAFCDSSLRKFAGSTIEITSKNTSTAFIINSHLFILI